MARSYTGFLNRPLDPSGYEGLTESLLKSYEGGFNASRLPQRTALEDALARATIESTIQGGNLNRENAIKQNLANLEERYFLNALDVENDPNLYRGPASYGAPKAPVDNQNDILRQQLSGGEPPQDSGMPEQDRSYEDLTDEVMQQSQDTSGIKVKNPDKKYGGFTKSQIIEMMRDPIVATKLRARKIAPEISTEYNKTTGELVKMYKWPDGDVDYDVTQVGMSPSEISYNKEYGKTKNEQALAAEQKMDSSLNTVRKLDKINNLINENEALSEKTIGPMANNWMRYTGTRKGKRLLGELESMAGTILLDTLNSLRGSVGIEVIRNIEKNYKLDSKLPYDVYMGRLEGIMKLAQEAAGLNSFIATKMREPNSNLRDVLDQAYKTYDIENFGDRYAPITKETVIAPEAEQEMSYMQALEAALIEQGVDINEL